MFLKLNVCLIRQALCLSEFLGSAAYRVKSGVINRIGNSQKASGTLAILPWHHCQVESQFWCSDAEKSSRFIILLVAPMTLNEDRVKLIKVKLSINIHNKIKFF